MQQALAQQLSRPEFYELQAAAAHGCVTRVHLSQRVMALVLAGSGAATSCDWDGTPA